MITIDDFYPEAAVLDAGDFPTAKTPSRIMLTSPRLVCCDGAAAEFVQRVGRPWRIVGDGDSLPSCFREQYKDILRLNPDQETNDQTKAVTYLHKKGYDKIAILGATGKREDHTLGNISLLIEYMKMGIEVRIYTDYGVFVPLEGDAEFSVEPHSQISVFSFGAYDMRSEGLRYPLRTFGALWQGTLNEAVSSKFRIFAKGFYLVFINYPKLQSNHKSHNIN